MKCVSRYHSTAHIAVMGQVNNIIDDGWPYRLATTVTSLWQVKLVIL